MFKMSEKNFITYIEWNEYDLIKANELREQGFTNPNYFDKTYYGDAYDEMLILTLKKEPFTRFGISNFQYRRSMELLTDILYSPKSITDDDYKKFKHASYDHVNHENIKLPTKEQLINSDVFLVNYPNFRMYEYKINKTSIHECKYKSYESFDDVDWSKWKVICHVSEGVNSLNEYCYKVRGVPKEYFV